MKIRLGYAFTSIKNRMQDLEEGISRLEFDMEAVSSEMKLLESLITDEHHTDTQG